MPSHTDLTDLTHTIQMAVAPVFLLTALGTILNVLSGRLGRIVDRARFLADRVPAEGAEEQRKDTNELTNLGQRRDLINYAITAATAAALLVCLLIIVIFAGFMFEAKVAYPISILFISIMTAFTFALVLFLREILLAVASTRIR